MIDHNKTAWPIKILKAFLAAGQFLTIFPPVIRRPFTPKELGQSVGFYPLIGLLIGALLLAAESILLTWLPDLVRSAVILGLWIMLSGALHFDGLLDTFDGLFGGFNAESRLKIMRDERIGAFALAGGLIIILIKFSALSALRNPLAGLLLAPTFGRWGITAAVIFFPYARSQGLGSDIKENAGWPQIALSSLTAVATGWLVAGLSGLILLAGAGVFVWLAGLFILKRIPGLTGDVYGAINELVECMILVGLVITQ